MTTPNQSLPAGIEKWLGAGAYQIGGAGIHFGQDIAEEGVRALIHGPATALAQAFSSLPNFLAALKTYLSTLGLDTLQMFKPFIPDAVENAFDTVEAAVDTIVDALGLDQLLLRLADLKRLFAIDQLHTAFTTLVSSLLAIDWIPLSAADARAAFAAVWQFVKDLGEWGSQVVETFTTVARSSYSTLLSNLWAAFGTADLRAAVATFRDAVTPVNLATPAGIRSALGSTVDLVREFIHWLVGLFKTFVGFDLSDLAGAFGISVIRSTVAAFADAIGAVVLPGVSGVVAAISAVLSFMNGSIGWIILLISKFTGVDLTEVYAALELPTLRAALTGYRDEISGLDLLTPGGVRAGLMAAAHLAKAIIDWATLVVDNLTGVDATAVLSSLHLPELRATLSDFRVGITGLDLLSAVGIRAAFVAFLGLLKGLVQWAIAVIADLTGVDLTEVYSALELPTLRAALSAFREAISGLDLLAPGGVRAGLNAVIDLVKALINWAILVIANLTGKDITAVMSALHLSDLRATLSAYREAISGLDLLTAEGIREAFVAFLGLIKGIIQWAIEVIASLTGVDLTEVYAALELPMLRETLSTFRTTIAGIDVLAPGGIRAGLNAVIDLLKGIVQWGIQVVLNLTGVDLTAVFSALALAQLRGVLSTFRTDIAGLDLLTPGGLRAAVNAVVDLVKGIVQWGIQVVLNLTGVDLTDAFGALKLQELRDVFSTYRSEIEGLNLLTASGLRDAVAALVHLFSGVVNWAIDVVNTLTGIDMGLLRTALALDMIRDTISTFRDTMMGINWLVEPAGINTFIHAVFEFFRGVGQWLLAVFENILAINTDNIRDMFSTFPKFVNTVFLYMFHFTPAHIAEFISGIIGGLKDWLLDLPARMVSDAVQSIRDKLTGIVDSTPGNLDDWLLDLVTHGSTILQHLTSAGQYHAAAGFADPISLSDIASRFGLADAGADFQALVDKAVNGFGGASSGNTLADFLSKFTDVHAKAAAAYGSSGDGPGTPGYVADSEGTSSTSAVDLDTTTDYVDIVVPDSGNVIISYSAKMANNTVNCGAAVCLTASGANTISAADQYTVSMTNTNLDATMSVRIGEAPVLTGLDPGATRFKLKYKAVGGGHASFALRRISGVPL